MVQNAKGIILIASGKHNAGEGHAEDAQDDFAEAFEILAPVRAIPMVTFERSNPKKARLFVETN